VAYDAPEDQKGLQLGRRQFITWSAGGAYVLAVASPTTADPLQEARPNGAPVAAPPADGRGASPWFKINADGRMTVLSNAVEMGQGSHTGHATIIADELDMPWDRVDVQMLDMQAYNNTVRTGGSRSIVTTFDTARKAGATARAQFISAAAKKWGADPSACSVSEGSVVGPAGQKLAYVELVSDAAAAAVPANATPKVLASRKMIGKPLRTQKVKSKTDGTMIYGLDVRVPGMLHASSRKSPVYGGKLISVDPAPAMAIPGVKQVVKLDDSVAVLATDTFTAIKAVRALKPQWSTPDTIPTATAEIPAKLDGIIKAEFAKPPKPEAQALRAAYDSAPRKVEVSYDLAHVCHVTMEPQNCAVHVTKDKIEIWAPTQVPSPVIQNAPGWAGKPANTEVVLHTTMLGGGFGRRLDTNYVQQAVELAAKVEGPVQLVWSREEDFGHDTYRRAVRQMYRAGLGADGGLDSYECVTAATDAPVNSGMNQAPYQGIKPATVTQAGMVKAGIPQGPWRSVDPGISAFGRESFIDECAHAAGADPVAYRLKLLGTNERAKRLLQTVADKIDFKKKRPAGTGVGVAVGEGFGSVYAHAIEVQVKGKQLKVTRFIVAADLGTVVAPNQVEAQFQGGGLMALSTALGEVQTFADGKAVSQNFDQYTLLRHSRAPKVEVHLFDSPEAPIGGSGEPPMPTVAPALCNAIYAATKKRVRALPIKNQGFDV
jgi:isoquinoline 1-oxidoreductase beta subunit